MSYLIILLLLLLIFAAFSIVYFLKFKNLKTNNKNLKDNNEKLLFDLANLRVSIDNFIEESGQILIITDLKGQIVIWNKNAVSAFGFPKEEALNKHIQFLDLENDPYNFQSIIDEVLVSGELKYLEFRKRTANGKQIDLITTATLLKNPDGDPHQINFSIEDFSERNQLVEMRVNHEKLLAGIDSLNKLLGTLSHYINNSITSISGMAQLVEMDEKYNAKFLSISKIQIEKIQAVLKSLGVLVDSLNLKSREYAGEKGIFDIENEIKAFLDTFVKKPAKE